MSSRPIAIVALTCVMSGCAEDPAILVYLEGRATEIMELAPSSEPISARQGSFRWDIINAPPGSNEPVPQGEKTATFQPDLRGTYLIERWLTYGIGEDLTHRFVVHISGAPPFATFHLGSPSVAVNNPVVIDGNPSSSVEGLSLSHHWRLVRVPPSSNATIPAQGALVSFSPDIVGDYVVELSVFDGELWSDPSSQLVVARALVSTAH